MSFSAQSLQDKIKVKKLMSFRIVKEKLLYVIGIPRRYASDEILRSKSFCGQYGQIERIVINYNPKDVYEGQVAVYVHYKTPINVAMGLQVSIIKFNFHQKVRDILNQIFVVPEWTSDERWEYSEVLLWY